MGNIKLPSYSALWNSRDVRVKTIWDLCKHVKELQSGGSGSGGIITETDPTVPSWAKASSKPSYTVSEIDGALSSADAASTYETKADATSKKTALESSIASLSSQIASITGLSGVNFGGIVAASTDIATHYTTDGYSGTYLYLVGSDMTSLTAYEYVGSGDPTQLFSGTTYDFTDYSDVQSAITAIQTQLNDLGTKSVQSGTFEQAYAKSQINNIVFPWLLVDTVDGDSIIKPIWHVGNSVFVDAIGVVISIEASAPSVPTITIDGSTATSGSTVAKDTQIVITPSSGVLYYKTSNDASYTTSTSAVTLTLGTAGNITIQAYCRNSAGNSSVVSVALTVEGTAVPVFSAASGEVSRGATVTITASGTLYYSTDGGTTWTNGGASASVQITGNTTIQAYNVVDGEQSDTITRTYTMAALAAPTFSIASGTELRAGGQNIIISATGTSIKYTTDDTDPSSSGTATTVNSTSATVSVTTALTIRAITIDAYGSSAVASATYTIAVAKIVVTASGATTMSLGDSGLTELTINEGTTEFTPEDLGISSFNDHAFASLSFGDNTLITSFNGGGVKITAINGAFQNAAAVTSVSGIYLNGGSAHSAFNFTRNLAYCQISGSASIVTSMFYFADAATEIDLTGFDTSGVTSLTGFASMFRQCDALTKITIGNLTNANASDGGYVSLMFRATPNITDLYCTETTPPVMHSSSWIAALIDVVGSNNLSIHVPSGTLSAYQSAWGSDLAVTWIEY